MCESCDSGYYGSSCTVCPDCNAHGTCNDGIDGNGQCTCDAGWTGNLCDECESNYYGENCLVCPNCGTHGTCDSGLAGSGQCICNQGWSGSVCDQTECGDGVLVENEQCEKTGELWDACCDSESCQFKTSTTVCRSAAGVCDVEEKCTGISKDCPVDQLLPDETICDDEDPCTGIGICQNGACVADELDCDDQNSCTEDYCDGLTGCVHPSLADGSWCDGADEGWERCYDGQCLSINDGEVCDLPIGLQIGYPESFTTDGMINIFSPDEPCSEDLLEGPDIFFKVTLQPGAYWISVDPEDEADLAIVLIDSCNPVACTYSIDDAGLGGIEAYGPIVVEDTRGETTVLFSIDSVSYETAGSFEILVERETIVDGDEDLDLEPDQDTEIEEWPDGDIDTEDGDFDLDDDLDEPTETDVEETTPDGDIDDDWDSAPDGDQVDDDIADGDVVDGDKEEPLADGDEALEDGDQSLPDGDASLTDGDDGTTPPTGGSGGGGGCQSTGNGGALFLGIIICLAWLLRRRKEIW